MGGEGAGPNISLPMTPMTPPLRAPGALGSPHISVRSLSHSRTQAALGLEQELGQLRARGTSLGPVVHSLD